MSKRTTDVLSSCQTLSVYGESSTVQQPSWFLREAKKLICVGCYVLKAERNGGILAVHPIRLAEHWADSKINL